MTIRLTFLGVAALACAAAYASEAVTIIGEGSHVTIIEKDGTVRELSPASTSFLNGPDKARLDAKERKARDEAKLRQREEEQAQLKAKQDLEAERKKLEAEKAKAAEEAAKREKAFKEQQENLKKEIKHYNDKDYTYGPGSAKATDKTGAIVQKKKLEREEGPRRITVGGQTRVRSSHLSR